MSENLIEVPIQRQQETHAQVRLNIQENYLYMYIANSFPLLSYACLVCSCCKGSRIYPLKSESRGISRNTICTVCRIEDQLIGVCPPDVDIYLEFQCFPN